VHFPVLQPVEMLRVGKGLHSEGYLSRNCHFLRSVERYPHRVRIRPKMGHKRMPDGVVNCRALAAGAENRVPLVAQRNSRLDCDEKDPPLARFESQRSSGEAL
jgi:hypothetical protein